MLRRLLIGLVLGLVLGGLVAFGVIRGLGILAFESGVLAYLFAVLTGALTGLVAGKPIWASGAKIEAGLKAFFGVLLGAGAMVVLRNWVNPSVDLSAIGASQGPAALGHLPAA